MPDQSILFLAKDVRGKTLRLIEDVSESHARFAPPGLQNSILWHAGHALVVVEHLALAPLERRKESHPLGYFEAFSWRSNPMTVTAWPTLKEVRANLIEQRDRLLAAIEGADDAQLNSIVDPPGRPLRFTIVHGFHDEANHQGEIWLLKKLLRTKGSEDGG
jgi:hypothetical protein